MSGERAIEVLRKLDLDDAGLVWALGTDLTDEIRAVLAEPARPTVTDAMVERAEKKFWEPTRIDTFRGETSVIHRSDMRAALEAALTNDDAVSQASGHATDA